MSLVLDFVKKETSGTAHVSAFTRQFRFFLHRPYFIWALCQAILMWNIHSAKVVMPWVSCAYFNIGWSVVASVQQRSSWNVNAGLQQICRRLVNGAIKGKSVNRGLALNTEVFKKWTVGLLLLDEFGARVLFWITLVWDFLGFLGFLG